MNYYEVKAYNATAIKAGAISMLHMKHALDGDNEATAAMKRGTLQHRAVLEPETLRSLVVMEYDGRTKEGKALVAEHGDNLIKPAAFAELSEVHRQVHQHPEVAGRGLLSGGVAEKEIYWRENGRECKAKLDYIAPEHFIEYKTCNNLAGFARSAAAMRYNLQFGWYWRAAYCFDGKYRQCFIIAQESKAPFDVAVFEVPRMHLEAWYNAAIEIVAKYESGDRSGAFPSLMQFELPAWAQGASPEADPEAMIEF